MKFRDFLREADVFGPIVAKIDPNAPLPVDKQVPRDTYPVGWKPQNPPGINAPPSNTKPKAGISGNGTILQGNLLGGSVGGGGITGTKVPQHGTLLSRGF